MVGHLVSGGESKEPAALLWGRRRNRKQGPTAHLLPAAAAAGCNALAQAQLERGGQWAEEGRLDHLTVRKGGSGGVPTILSYCQHMDNYISRTQCQEHSQL